ncbi:glycoside hydrolase domain-containing protein [Desulfopila sp. IMCC35008]|uniref:glycoside hydrolase domain-containing protein n=1 Tax=Desulfopila sp. IMCC35008 TaxID=2653858 RepID=UPI0013D1DA75|nr:glycoside hydrolase domain-containing protein [Desulfopila sp. IMCC35008]
MRHLRQFLAFHRLVFLVLLAVKPASTTELEKMTFRMEQSSDEGQIWIAPPAEKIFRDAPVPSDSGSAIRIYCAKNEFEPFQVILKPSASGSFIVTMGTFGSGIKTELSVVKYVNISTVTDYFGRTGLNPDPLWPIENGDSIPVTTNQNTSFWVNVYVPKTTPAGDYTTTITIGTVSIPIHLHVFDFMLPEELHVKSQMNINHNTILTHYGVEGTNDDYWLYVDKIKQFLIDHRLTPKSVLWSGGITSTGGGPYINYDCNGTFTDNDGIWGFEQPAARFLDGSGLMSGHFESPFNGDTGFPSFMAATFQNNDASSDQRPSPFCGQTRSAGDWYTANNPNSAYNTKWFEYITALQNYLQSLNYLDEAYYYMANEPQDQADYDAVAWYSQELKNVAPNLKLMVSEEPKPEIYNHPAFSGSKIDIWLAHFGLQFNPAVSWDRLTNHNEESWIYFLHGTRLPRFNPITIDHPGIEGKLTGWFLWKYRLSGIAYYQFNTWTPNPWTTPMDYGQNGNRFLMYPPSENSSPISYGSNNHRFVSSIRLEMLRDGLEDYEYMYLLNNSQAPYPGVTNQADSLADKVIGDTVAYSRDSAFIYNLRKVIGQKLGGEIATIPNLTPSSVHPRSEGAPEDYYINFQNPTGEPTATPLIVNGNTYMKIGNSEYNTTDGYGWIPAAEVPDSGFYAHWDQWIDPQPKELLGSSVIDSWGRHDVFEFDLPNGTYNVTAVAGSRSTPRYQNISIEGVVFMEDEETSNSWITRTKQVTVRDRKLTMVMGKYEKIGYINYLDIEAAEVAGDVDCDGDADLQDVIAILRITTGEQPDMSNCTSLPTDINSDSRIGIAEAIWLLDNLSQ